MAIEISVVVPTYKRDSLLLRCLRALRDQSLHPQRYEIIVADDGASVDTRRLVESESASQNFPRMRYLATAGTRGPAAARNRGWRSAAGEVIAFTDDDCIPDPGWLRCGLAAISGGAAGVSGRIVVPTTSRPHDYARTTARLANAEFATANCFYRRSALESVGGFDERFTRAWREDADLYFTLLERNEKLVFSSAPVVVHPVRQAKWGVCIGEQKKSMFNALLYKKHAALFRRRIQPSPPWRYYLIAASFFGMLAGIAAGGHAAPAAGACWLACTGDFCLRRLKDTSRSLPHVAEMAITSLAVPFLSIFWRLYGAVKFRVVFF